PVVRLRAHSRAAGIAGNEITFERLRRFHAREIGLQAEGTPPASADSSAATSPEVRRRRAGEPAFIDRQELPAPTPSQFVLIAALLDAGPRGLSTRELSELKLGGWRESLSKLRGSHRLWERIIVFPGRPHGRYRIAARQAR